VTGGGATVANKQYAEEIGPLRTGTHDVVVTVKSGVLIVDFDGQQVLALKVALPSSVMLAYTAGTDSATDMHVVRNAAIGATKFVG